MRPPTATSQVGHKPTIAKGRFGAAYRRFAVPDRAA